MYRKVLQIQENKKCRRDISLFDFSLWEEIENLLQVASYFFFLLDIFFAVLYHSVGLFIQIRVTIPVIAKLKSIDKNISLTIFIKLKKILLYKIVFIIK